MRVSTFFKKANGRLFEDRSKAGRQFFYSAKISHHYVILCHHYSVHAAIFSVIVFRGFSAVHRQSVRVHGSSL